MSFFKGLFGGKEEARIDTSGNSNGLKLMRTPPEPLPKPNLPSLPEPEQMVNISPGMQSLRPDYYSLEAKGLVSLEPELDGIELEMSYRTPDHGLTFTHTLSVPISGEEPPKYSILGVINHAAGALVSRVESSGGVMGRWISKQGGSGISCTAQYGGTEEERSVAVAELEATGTDWSGTFKYISPSATELSYSQSLFRDFHLGFNSYFDWTQGHSIYGFHHRYLKQDHSGVFTASCNTNYNLNTTFFASLNPHLYFATEYTLAVDHRSGSLESATCWGVQANYFGSKWKGTFDTNYRFCAQYEEQLGPACRAYSQVQSDLLSKDVKVGLKLEFGDSLQKEVLSSR